MRFTSTCSKAARALRYINGKAMTAAAITHPFQVCTTLKSKLSSKNFPNGLRRLNIRSRKKPATVGGSTSGIVRIPSRTALDTGFSFMIFLAQKIPKKNAMTVATKPVFKEIHSGLQLISCINSIILSNSPVCTKRG